MESILGVTMKTLLALLIVVLGAVHAGKGLASDRQTLPEGFVYLDDAVPGLVIDLRYTGSDNFLGRPVDGY